MPVKRRRLSSARRTARSNPEMDWGAELGKGEGKLLLDGEVTPVKGRRILIGLFCLVPLALLTGILLWLNEPRHFEAPIAGEPPVKVPVAEPPSGRSEKTHAAILTVDRFFLAEDSESKKSFLFDESESSLMKSYYAKRARPRMIDPRVTAVELKGREILLVSFRDGEGREWAAPVEWRISEYRLHWGAMVGAGEMDWRQFLARKSQILVTMRVNLTMTDEAFFKGEFDGNLSGLLEHPDLEEPLVVLVAPSRETRALPVGRKIPLMVAMRFNETSSGYKSPLIAKVFHPSWIRN